MNDGEIFFFRYDSYMGDEIYAQIANISSSSSSKKKGHQNKISDVPSKRRIMILSGEIRAKGRVLGPLLFNVGRFHSNINHLKN